MKKVNSTEKELNIKYALLQIMFWTAAASAYAFLTQVLQYKGFNGTEIGILNAVKLFSTVVFQVIIGSFSDKYAKKIPLKYIIAFLAVAACVLTLIFYAVPLSFLGTVLLFVGFGATFTCISPLIDALSMLYINHGQPVEYVWGRAAGSVAWAVACVLFGIFCDAFGANHLLLLQMAFIAGIALVAVMMNPIKEIKESKIVKQQERTVHTTGYLLKNYPKYTWFLIGSAVMFMGYNFGTTFLINVIEELGGNNTHYGIAEFVMAMSEVPGAYILLKCRNKISLDKMMICCAFFMMLKNAFATYTDSIAVIICSQSCEMLGFGLFYAGSVYVVGDMLPEQDIVKGVSLINAATVGLGEGVAALFCGMIRTELGLHNLMQVSVIASIASILCMIVMCKLPIKKKKS